MAKATPKPSAKPTPKPKFTRKPGEVTPQMKKDMAKMSPLDRKRYEAMIKGEKTAGKRSKNTI